MMTMRVGTSSQLAEKRLFFLSNVSSKNVKRLLKCQDNVFVKDEISLDFVGFYNQ